MSDQWEGRERRIGRPTRADEPASMNLVIRVTPAEKRALRRLAAHNQAASLADFCRLVLNEAAAELEDAVPTPQPRSVA